MIQRAEDWLALGNGTANQKVASRVVRYANRRTSVLLDGIYIRRRVVNCFLAKLCSIAKAVIFNCYFQCASLFIFYRPPALSSGVYVYVFYYCLYSKKGGIKLHLTQNFQK